MAKAIIHSQDLVTCYVVKVIWLCMKLGQDGKLFVFISFIPQSTHIIVWNAKRAENIILTHRGIQLLKS